jgi:hypothetical protein
MYAELTYEALKTVVNERMSKAALARRARLVRGRRRPRPANAMRVSGWRRLRIGKALLGSGSDEQANEPFQESQPARRYIGIVPGARVGMTAVELEDAIEGER